MEAAGLLAAPAPRRAGEAGAAARPGRRRDHGEGAVRGSAKGLQRARLRVMAVSAVACVAAVVLLGRTRFASPSVSNEGFAGLVRLTVDTGSWCSNYRDIQIGTSIVAPNEGLCRTHCNANADCEFFIFKARSDCGDSSFDDNVCLIVGKNCTMQNNACFDLHPKNDAALDYLIHRAPAASVPTSVDASSAVNFVEDHRERDTGCSNWEDIQADETAHVESRRDCSTRCVGANGCVAFNYRERDDCEGAPGSKGACVLLREGCKRVESPCFDLYPAPGAGASSSQGNWAPEGAPPAPPTTSVGASSAADLAPGRPERDVGCSNWMDIQAAVPTSVASQRECSEGCDSTEGCVAFNYVERVDCEGAGGSRGSCALFREGCQKAHSPCFDFYPRLGPEASLAKARTRRRYPYRYLSPPVPPCGPPGRPRRHRWIRLEILVGMRPGRGPRGMGTFWFPQRWMFFRTPILGLGVSASRPWCAHRPAGWWRSQRRATGSSARTRTRWRSPWRTVTTSAANGRPRGWPSALASTA
ncbi:unnamed protein product [Prorocentrum cordatum]|uniref:Apple domain-containing protein n=1 Tax=Prorocentrum cordatum TaxID=2364126 RepID=A0ABN9SPH0_9DINO|nr:unnamed protein product [Polarella glacialis]